jgi:proteasome beta subunit
MTTTVGIIYNDGVILASDQRATMGSFIACKTAQKIHMISSTVGFTIAGGVGDAQELIRVLRSEAAIYQFRRGSPMRVSAVNSLLSNFMTQNRAYPYEVHPTIGGFDDTGARLFTMDAVGGSSEEVRFTSTGSGSPAALGILEEYYIAGMSEDEAIAMAIRCVATAKKRDAASGEATAIVVIDKEGFRNAKIIDG